MCSVVGGSCIEVPQEKHKYDRFYETHYACVQKGMSDAYKVLFDGNVFAADQVESLEIYPKFSCDKLMVPPKKPKSPVSLFPDTKVSYIFHL
tara:strand:- start:2073 stop:2348 length:276 start_codon:yes stop_codon:yes gene_type:complete